MTSLLAGAVAAHRFVFILGTALLAVGTSQLADGTGDTGSWLLSAGGALLMFVGDQLQDIERTSNDLSSSSGTDIGQARADLFSTRRPLLTGGVLVAAVAMSVAGLLVS